MCSDAQDRQFGVLRTRPEKVLLVAECLAEGMGVRAAARIAKCHRDTVLRILRHAGLRAHEWLEKKISDIPMQRVEGDEIHTFVHKKYREEIDPETDRNWWGDYYIFLAQDADSKLMLMPTIGKRSVLSTERFAADIASSVNGKFQLTTDGFRPYKNAMKSALKGRVDFAQFYKERNMLNVIKNKKRGVFSVRCGSPNLKLATTAHIERANLSMRTHNRRFVRRGISFSKEEEFLRYSVFLWAAFHNFCRVHSSLGRGTTPAMASKIAQRKLEIGDLLKKPLANLV